MTSAPLDSSPEGEPEGLRLVRLADGYLAEGRFTEAVQLYWQAVELLKTDYPEAAQQVLGYHHFAKAIAAYFDDKSDLVLDAIMTARACFAESGLRDQEQLCAALEPTLRALLAHERDDYVAAEADLHKGVALLDALIYTCPALAATAGFWKDWACMTVYGGRLCHQVDALGMEEAEELLATIGGHLSSLAARGGTPAAHQFFGGFGTLYSAAVAVSRALDAYTERAHKMAIQYAQSAASDLRSSHKALVDLQLPPSIGAHLESFLFLEAMAQTVGRFAAAEHALYHGDHTAAMSLAHATVAFLVERRTLFTPSIRGGSGYDVDVDDLLDDARKVLARTSAGDPGILRLHPEVARVVPPNMLEETLAQIRELTNAYMSRLWISTLALAGGLLETLLIAALTRHLAATSQGGAAQLTNLKLVELVERAKQAKLLRSDAVHLSHGLREFRNLLHPGKRLREAKGAAESEARAACAILQVVVRALAENGGANQDA